MRKLCERKGVELDVVYGEPSATDLTRQDNAKLPWGTEVRNKYISLFGKELVWQKIPEQINDADLVIVSQENRILSNYPLLLNHVSRKLPIAYWGHGRNFQRNGARGIREWWKKGLLKHVDWWFGYTTLTSQTVIENGMPEGRVTVLNNSIDTKAFRADIEAVTLAKLSDLREQFSIGFGEPVGLYCGSLNEDKRLELLVEASDKIRETHPNFHLFVVGDGPMADYIRTSFASRPGRHYVGKQLGIEKAAFFKLARVILNPGLVGLSIVDAFAAGLPLVTMKGSKHSPEIVYLENGVNGVVAEDDIHEFSSAVIDLLNDDRRRLEMAANAQAAGDQYSIENMAENFVNGILAFFSTRPQTETLVRVESDLETR